MNTPPGTHQFVPSGFFSLRTPLLPFDELVEWCSGLEVAAAVNDPGRLEMAFIADCARLRERLQAVFKRPEVREALFVASPDLEERLDLWFQEPESERGRKIERALIRYFARMAGRATPFGLFAGCSVGTLGAESRLVLAERARNRRHTRLDMDYLVLLTDALARDGELRPTLTFSLNSSLYPVRRRFRYFEVRRNGKGWTHHQVALETSPYLESTLRQAEAGALPQSLTAALLQHDPEAASEDADEFVGSLIDSQVLVSELRPAVTGPEPIGLLAARLRKRMADSPCERLEQTQQELELLDAQGLGIDPSCYRRIAELLAGLPGEVELGRLFQVDMIKPATSATLGPAVMEEFTRGVRLLQRLTRRPTDDPLKRFRQAFVARYEGQTVPLVEALDQDTGVGFGALGEGTTDASSLLDGVTFPKSETETVPWGARDAVLLRLLNDTLTRGADQIELKPHDIEAMTEKDFLPLPDAFAVMGAVAAESEPALNRGAFQALLTGVSGPSGARLLGRFCHADPELHDFVRQHIGAEESLRPDAVFAEIVHLTEGRLGNILARPVLRDYEIPYLGHAGVPAEQQILVSDLLISVVGEEIMLWSERLGRRILPRLTSAHGFHTGQGIYRFLCMLQSQETAGDIAWDWGVLRCALFLPRVVSGRLVLSRAAWRATAEELKLLGKTAGACRFRAVQDWRVARRLPRWITLADGDNELPIDLDNVLSVETFVELVKGRDQATLIELFPGPDQLVVRGPEGRFVHELIVPFVRTHKTSVATPDAPVVSPSVHATAPVRRRFPPGSEWLFFKLYSGPSTVDEVLRDLVRPLVKSAMSSGAADSWFFIRYGDPDWHLRLRFHGDPARLLEELLPTLHAAAAPLLDDGRLSRVQFDTYQREIERYGGSEGIVLAERLFQADSEAVLALDDTFAGDARGEIRWRLALLGMHQLLDDLGFDLTARREMLSQMRGAFAAELCANAKLKRELAEKFRRERRTLEAILNRNAAAKTPVASALRILRRRSESLIPVAAELRACAQAGRLSVPLSQLAQSYLHMHANRLLRSAHRAQELVLYEFLARLYDSQVARHHMSSCEK